MDADRIGPAICPDAQHISKQRSLQYRTEAGRLPGHSPAELKQVLITKKLLTKLGRLRFCFNKETLLSKQGHASICIRNRFYLSKGSYLSKQGTLALNHGDDSI